ncbi:MAG: ferredoxin--NADP reductase [Pseudarcicella sp.]|nr:ferredoxin--NADP reductase [Pseudarcicella sp.]
MPSKHIFLTVKEIIQETPTCKTFVFWQPPHQSVSYKAGQFLTVLANINGQTHRRSYSMSSSPHKDASLAITVKAIEGGLVSDFLVENLKVGDALEVIEPAGNFVLEPNPSLEREIVMIAGGSGITPLMSMIKSVLHIEQNSKVSLIYGSKNEENIIFSNQLTALENQYPNRFQVLHVLSQPSYTWVGYKTRINQASMVIFLKQNLQINIAKASYYLCGPSGMMEQAKAALNLFDVPSNQIHQEYFTNASTTQEEKLPNNTMETQIVELRYEGDIYHIAVKPSETILEAALNADIDLPYSCQAGMCTACMAKVKSGTVKMDEEDGLTEKEIKDGYILTCVAHPTSAGVVLDVD